MTRNTNTDTTSPRPTNAAVREWARRNGIVVNARGPLPVEVVAAYEQDTAKASAAPAARAVQYPARLSPMVAPVTNTSAAPAAATAPAPVAAPAAATATATPLRVAAITDSIDPTLRCDYCNARAYVLTKHAAGTLAWCKHHAEKIAIPAGQALIADARHLLAA